MLLSSEQSRRNYAFLIFVEIIRTVCLSGGKHDTARGILDKRRGCMGADVITGHSRPQTFAFCSKEKGSEIKTEFKAGDIPDFTAT